jgi:hypothetical protein
MIIYLEEGGSDYMLPNISLTPISLSTYGLPSTLDSFTLNRSQEDIATIVIM